jgi:hypothetical protein
MRLWLKDSERKPDPPVVKTDDRKAVLVGLALWVVALVTMLIFIEPLINAGLSWWLWTCAAGLVLGLAGLLYTQRRHTN